MKKRVALIMSLVSIFAIGGVSVYAAGNQQLIQGPTGSYAAVCQNHCFVTTAGNAVYNSISAHRNHCVGSNLCVYNTEAVYPEYPEDVSTADDAVYVPEASDNTAEPAVYYPDSTADSVAQSSGVYCDVHGCNDDCYQNAGGEYCGVHGCNDYCYQNAGGEYCGVHGCNDYCYQNAGGEYCGVHGCNDYCYQNTQSSSQSSGGGHHGGGHHGGGHH